MDKEIELNKDQLDRCYDVLKEEFKVPGNIILVGAWLKGKELCVQYDVSDIYGVDSDCIEEVFYFKSSKDLEKLNYILKEDVNG